MSETRATQKFDLVRLKHELKPFKLHWFPTLGSTNTHAAKMRREGRLLAPSVVLTGRQTSGRGRGSNQWHSPAGVITATFIFPAHDTLAPQHIPLVAGLAVRNAVAGLGVSEARIKWPNDIWVHDRKLAGLLCERIGNIDLIGIGINVNVDLKRLGPRVQSEVTSIQSEQSSPIGVTDVLTRVAGELRTLLNDSRTSLARVLPDIRAVDALISRKIRISGVDQVLEGVYDGIDASGRLLIRVRGRQLALFTGSVTVEKARHR